ncbi:hypothetical protein DD237_000865 [Peronospora effusa]|uniref:Uncharacterized protein n=1 Tax=Peronospora effusa TaxID=542832 RepID=A0A3R7YEH4_9STRA|nr:hypothetical protein DD237_000865 [Peronospora effusa]
MCATDAIKHASFSTFRPCSSDRTTSAQEYRAPCHECRNVFLDLVRNYVLYLAIGSVIVIVGSVAVGILSCYLRRRDMYDVYEAF